MLGNILLGIVSICTFTAYLPQIFQLIKTKSSKDLSIASWCIWVISTMCYALYAIFVSHDKSLIFVTTLEHYFCVIILLLAIRYRFKNKRKKKNK